MQIRRAAEADVDEMLRLLGAVADEGRWLLTESAADFLRRRQQFVDTAKHERAGLFVAVRAAQIVGQMSVIPEAGGLWGLGMAVEEASRGSGVGSALMQAGIAFARQAGAHKIVLEVFPHNEAALALYEKFGFVREGYRAKHFRRKNGELWDVIPMGLVL